MNCFTAKELIEKTGEEIKNTKGAKGGAFCYVKDDKQERKEYKNMSKLYTDVINVLARKYKEKNSDANVEEELKKNTKLKN